MSAIRWYQHAESGSVHGFALPMHPEIAKQIASGVLVRVTDPSSGMDPDEKIAQLEAKLARLVELSGIDPSSLEPDGLADTSGSGAEPTEGAGEDEEFPEPEDDGEDDSFEGLHLCEACGDPVERNGKTGPWPKRHKSCK